MTSFIPFKTRGIPILISIIEVFIGYFFTSILVYRIYVWETGMGRVLMIIGMLMAVFLIIYALVCIKDKVDERIINEQIRNREYLEK